MKKFNLLAVLLTICSATFTVPGVAQELGDDPPPLELVEVASNLSAPTVITNAGDERMFIVLQPGVIKIFYRNGLVQSEDFLDIQDRVYSQGSERGLLGLAFPPDFCTNPYFYVNYTYREFNTDYTRVSRFSIDENNSNKGDESSEEVLLQFIQPYPNHNGGHLEFGPDGYLYIATGDGGLGGDPGNRSQNLSMLLGKILRIDVSSQPGYEVPEDNPFVSTEEARDEIWAYGLRNPWKFAFDSETGDLYIADVGQNIWEEVNFEPADSPGGVNYGWRCYEGTHVYDFSECDSSTVFEMPVFEYSHQNGCSVTGGRIYRGPSFESMTGHYFFTDLCSGLFRSITRVGGEWTVLEYGSLGTTSITTFGEDVWGEIYVAAGSGVVYRLEDQDDELVEPIQFTDGNTLTSMLEGSEYHWELNGDDLGQDEQSITITESGSYSLTVVTDSGCEVYYEIDISIVGTRDSEIGKLDFQLYPNPGKDAEMRVVLAEGAVQADAYLEFFDASGRLVESVPLASGGDSPIRFSNASPGFYVVKLSDGRGVLGVAKYIRE